MTNKIEKFRNKIRIKSQLINLSSEELLEEYQNKDDYSKFLKTLDSIVNFDNMFLLLDHRFIEKIEDVILEKRFNIKDEECIEQANQIIRCLNIIKSVTYDQTEFLFDIYTNYHEYVRKVKFDTLEDLINTISYDEVVFAKLEEGNVDDIPETFFFSSTNYFLQNVPKIYQNKSFKSLTEERLKKMSQKPGINNIFTNMNAKILLKTIKSTNKPKKNND